MVVKLDVSTNLDTIKAETTIYGICYCQHVHCKLSTMILCSSQVNQQGMEIDCVE